MNSLWFAMYCLISNCLSIKACYWERNLTRETKTIWSTTVSWSKPTSDWNPSRLPRMFFIIDRKSLMCWLHSSSVYWDTILFLSSSKQAAQSRITSAPKPNARDPSSFSVPEIKSSGSISSSAWLLLIFSFASSNINPWVFSILNGAYFFRAIDVTKEQRNQRECWSQPSR